jgi:CRP/FNR family cyclic AMP-dependent transcriptional regulator
MRPAPSGPEVAPGGAAFLHALAPSDAAALRARGLTRRYPPATALFHELEAPGRVYLLLAGFVKLSRLSEDGREVILGIRGPGDLLGEQSAIDGSPRSATAIALDQVTAVVLAGSEFRAVLANHPQVALVLLRMLSLRLREGDLKRVELSVQDTVARVAARIIELGERFGEEVDGHIEINLPMSQDELASWTGCSRDSVVKALQAMRTLGWLETGRRRMTILAPAELRRRTGA